MELGVDPFTVRSLGPVAFLGSAASAGFTHVSLRTLQPSRGSHPGSPIVDASNVDEIERTLAETGLRVAAVDIIDVSSEADFAAIADGLAIAARLGSPSVSVIAKSAEPASVHDGLARLAELALPLGISPRLEPISYVPLVNSLARAVEIVSAHPGVGLMVDTLHLHRMSTPLEEVRQALLELPCSVQINGVASLARLGEKHAQAGSPEDDPRRWEALDFRLLPGEGENDVPSILALLPPGLVPLLEAPNSGREATLGADRYLHEAARAARAVLNGLNTPEPRNV